METELSFFTLPWHQKIPCKIQTCKIPVALWVLAPKCSFRPKDKTPASTEFCWYEWGQNFSIQIWQDNRNRVRSLSKEGRFVESWPVLLTFSFLMYWCEAKASSTWKPRCQQQSSDTAMAVNKWKKWHKWVAWKYFPGIWHVSSLWKYQQCLGFSFLNP